MRKTLLALTAAALAAIVVLQHRSSPAFQAAAVAPKPVTAQKEEAKTPERAGPQMVTLTAPPIRSTFPSN